MSPKFAVEVEVLRSADTQPTTWASTSATKAAQSLPGARFGDHLPGRLDPAHQVRVDHRPQGHHARGVVGLRHTDAHVRPPIRTAVTASTSTSSVRGADAYESAASVPLAGVAPDRRCHLGR